MRFGVREADFRDLEERSRAFVDLSAYRYWSANLTGGDEPARVQGYQVTPNTFDLLGVPASRGRTFAPDEGAPGRDRVVVLSHGLWERRFGSSPGALGRVVSINDDPYTIIGVMPPKFEFPQFNFKGDLFVPLVYDPEARVLRERSANVVMVGRIEAATGLEAAQAEMDDLSERLAQDHPDTNRHRGVRVIPMNEMVARPMRPALLALSGAVAFLLLIACANVANLLLARAAGREKELAVRAALGASRARLLRQLLTESVLLALLGAASGLALAAWALDLLVASLPEFVINVQPSVLEISLNPRALGFSLIVGIGCGIGYGLLPALRGSRIDLLSRLKRVTVRGWSADRLQSFLAAAEVALAVVLLVGAGVFARSLLAVLGVDPGFQPKNVLVAGIALPPGAYAGAPARTAFYESVLERVAALPAVEAAGLVNALPLGGGDSGTTFLIAGQPELPPGEAPQADYRVVSPGYFDAMRIPLRRGRTFEEADGRSGQPVAVINETMARRFWRDQDPLGQRIRWTGPEAENPWHLVVGVVGDVRHGALTESAESEVNCLWRKTRAASAPWS
jgi:putative ABC transport system permease protein